MKRIFALAILSALLLLPSPAHAGYCGDDICGTGETCSSCRWDCGICPNETDSGGGVISTPSAKTVRIYGGSSGYVDCPITYLSHVYSGGFNTSVRIRIANPSGSSTGAFRLTLYSSLGWFVPKNLTYAQNPDGYDSSGSPYWDMPALGRNESTEIAFTAKGSVGLVDNVNLKADTLDRWGGGCTNFVPKSGSELGQNVSAYLDSINWSQDATVYYRADGMALVSLAKNGSFAAINVTGENFTAISNYGPISSLASGYVSATKPPFYEDVGKPYSVLNYTYAAKADAETECFAITGMDKHECVDRASCRYACASVPVCWYVGQVGWPFIDTMLDYRLSIDRANGALGRAANSSQDFGASPSYTAAESAYSDIESLNREETNVIFNPIFSKYNFCPPPDYAMPQMIDARRVLLDYMAGSCVETEKDGIISGAYAIGPALQRAEREAAALESARINASIALNASLLANASANCSLNLSINLTGMNFTCNISANGTAMNATANATKNATSNVTGNMTGNATGLQNQTGNATGTAANATGGNNGTSWEELMKKYPLRELPDIRSVCPVSGFLSALLLAAAIAGRTRRH